MGSTRLTTQTRSRNCSQALQHFRAEYRAGRRELRHGAIVAVTGRGHQSTPGRTNWQPEFKASPFPFYSIRAESPVSRLTLPSNETAWLVTRYDDAAFVLKDDSFVKDTANALSRDKPPISRGFVT